MKIVRTPRGARIVGADDVILSEILARPGATDTLFDVLAACVAALAPGPDCAVLGFAGGGMIAPLRAMGFSHPVRAVDLSRAGEPLFRELSDGWSGEVTLDEEDAVAWLRRSRTRYDLVVDDLSVHVDDQTIKPYASLDPLPELIRSRLTADGIAIVNVLPLPGTPWSHLLAGVSRAHERAVSIELVEYENRIVIAGDSLPPAAELSRRVRAALRAIGSSQEKLLAFRTLRP